jgi:hypothetical protein
VVIVFTMVLVPHSAVNPPGFSFLSIAPANSQKSGDLALGRLGAIETVAPLCLQSYSAARAAPILNVRSKVVR